MHKVKELMELRGLTRLELAQKSGVDNTALFRILYRNTKPTADTLIKLADALKVSTDIILGRKPLPSHKKAS